MNEVKGSFIGFVIGLLMICMCGYVMISHGIYWKDAAFFIWGLRLSWLNGYSRDTSHWRLQPQVILSIAGGIGAVIIAYSLAKNH